MSAFLPTGPEPGAKGSGGLRHVPLPLPFQCTGHNTLHAEHPAPCMVTTVLRSQLSKACEEVWAPLWTRQHLVPGGLNHTLTLKQWAIRAEAGTLLQEGTEGFLKEEMRRGGNPGILFSPAQGKPTEPWLWEPHLSRRL